MLVDFNDTSALVRENRNLYSGFGAAGLKVGRSEEQRHQRRPSRIEVAGREGLVGSSKML